MTLEQWGVVAGLVVGPLAVYFRLRAELHHDVARLTARWSDLHVSLLARLDRLERDLVPRGEHNEQIRGVREIVSAARDGVNQLMAIALKKGSSTRS